MTSDETDARFAAWLVRRREAATTKWAEENPAGSVQDFAAGWYAAQYLLFEPVSDMPQKKPEPET